MNRLVNFFSGRKKIREKHMRTVKLSNREKEEKAQIKKKWFKTKEEKNKLKRLTAKVMPTSNEELNAYNRELRGRSKFRKFFNKYYESNAPEAKKKYEPMALGIYQHPRNTRKAFDKEAARQPNNAIVIPPTTTEGLKKTPLIKNGKKVLGPDGQPVLIVQETQHESTMRTLPVLFDVWLRNKYRRQSDAVYFEDIPEQEWNELSNEAKQLSGAPLEEQSQRLFGKPLRFINDLINIEEEGQGRNAQGHEVEGKDTKLVKSRVISDDGSYARNPDGSFVLQTKAAVGGAISLGRYLPILQSTKREVMKTNQLVDLDRCGNVIPEDEPPRRRDRVSFKPLTTLKSNGCIMIFNTPKKFYALTVDMDADAEMYHKNWIILAKGFMSDTYATTMIFAKRFLNNLTIQDAIENWGIIGMDPLFYELLRIKYPNILMKLSSYIVGTKEFPYKKEKILKDHDNFLLLDSEFYSGEMEITVANPFREEEDNALNEIFTNAAKANKFLGMTPYMAFTCRKLNPQLWKLFVTEGQRNNSVENNNTVYATLNAKEKIVVDYLQFMRYMSILEEDPEPYNFRKAKASYKDPLGEPGIVSSILEIFNEDGAKNRRELTFYQNLVSNQLREGDNPRNIESQADIEALLARFKLNLRIRIPPIRNANLQNRRSRVATMRRGSEALPREIVWEVAENAGPRSARRTVRRTVPASSARPALSGFNEALRRSRLTKQEQREENIQRILQLERELDKAQAVYNAAVRRRGTRKGNLNYLARRANALVQNKTRSLTSSERQIVENNRILKAFPGIRERAEREIEALQLAVELA